jgi:hypothetical protein
MKRTLFLIVLLSASFIGKTQSCYKLVLKDIEDLMRTGKYEGAESKLNSLSNGSLCPKIDKIDFAKQKLKFNKIFDTNRSVVLPHLAHK